MLAAVIGCASEPTPTPSVERPSVVLITIDTLRADALGVYGASPTPSPRIDALASTAMVFDHAVTPLPETRPAHVSLFTSQYPRQHGVLNNTLDLPAAGDPTLTEILRDAGYQTAGFTGCVLLGDGAGAARGFGQFDSPTDVPQRPAEDVVPQAMTWLRQTESSSFFLWLHLFDPHMPYEPPAAPVAPGDETAPPATHQVAWPRFAWPELLDTADDHGGNLPADVLARARTLYAGEVAHVDAWLGRLVEALGQTVDLDKTILVIAADHGECFGNGTFFDHSNCLYDGAARVPLIIRYPAQVATGRSAVPASLVDVAPTILGLAGVPVPPTFRGRDLMTAGGTEPVFLQHPFYRHFDIVERGRVLDRLRAVAGEPTRPLRAEHELVGARDASWKYLVSADGEELFHLPSDPDEKRNVIAEEPEQADHYRRLVRRWRQTHPLRLLDPDQIDPALLENLRALGYV